MTRRSLPPSLLAALTIGVVAELGFLVLKLIPPDYERWSALLSGLPFAMLGTGFVGAREVAAKTSGRRNWAAHIAAIGFALAIARVLAVTIFNGYMMTELERVNPPSHDVVKVVFGVSYSISMVAAVGGLGFASRRVGLAIAAVALAVIGFPPHFVVASLLGPDIGAPVSVAFAVTRVAAWVLAGAALWLDDGEDAIEPARANSGLRLMASSLWLRVGAAALGAYVAFHGDADGEMLGKLSAFGVPVVLMLSLISFGNGALDVARSAVADVPRWTFVVAGAATLWCAGSMLGELPSLFGTVYVFEHIDRNDISTELVLELAVAIVTAGSIALAMTGITAFAWARQLLDLRARAKTNTAAFVIAMIGGLGLQRWCVANIGDKPPAELALGALVAAIAMLAGIVIAARLLRDAKVEVERVAVLPSAKLR